MFAELSDRAVRQQAGSRTVAKLDREAVPPAIGKKLVEEAAESWLATELPVARDQAAAELSQLLYHAPVMMLALDLKLADVYAHL